MSEKNKHKPKKIMKLFAISTQMTSSIIGMAVLGYFLDDYYNIEKNYLTLAFTLVGVMLGIYLLYKGVKGMSND